MEEKEKRELVLKIATSYLGVKESPANSNNVIFNTRFYGREVRNGDKPGATYAWCGTFVSEVFQEAGLPLGNIGYRRGFAGCPYALAHIKDWGKIISKESAQPGDIVFFDWNLDKRDDHVGILKAINLETNKLTCECIEGNTSIGNNSDGGEVMDRTNRPFKFATFVRPNVYN